MCSFCCFLWYYQSFMKSQEGKTESQKKYVEEFTWRTLLFNCTPSFLCHFLLFSSSPPFPFPSDVLAEWPLGILWGDTMNEGSKVRQSLAMSFLIVYKHRLVKFFYLIYNYFCYIYIYIYTLYIYIYIYIYIYTQDNQEKNFLKSFRLLPLPIYIIINPYT